MDSEDAHDNSSISKLLATTGEELKGKLQPAVVRVDEATLVEATRAQNQALLFLHAQLARLENKLDEVNTNVTKRMDDVEVKLQQWGSRVERLESRGEHHEQLLTRQEAINAEVKHFKSETTASLSQTREGLACLDAALKDLPNTIQIAATQVNHPRDDSDAENVAPLLTVEDSTRQHIERMDELETHTSNEISRVVQLVADQKKDDEAKLSSLHEAVERVEVDMKDTVTYQEVEDKIAVKVRELVDQIKEALLTVEEDEADFKNVAAALHGLFNKLKETKADKSEMAEVSCSWWWSYSACPSFCSNPIAPNFARYYPLSYATKSSIPSSMEVLLAVEVKAASWTTEG